MFTVNESRNKSRQEREIQFIGTYIHKFYSKKSVPYTVRKALHCYGSVHALRLSSWHYLREPCRFDTAQYRLSMLTGFVTSLITTWFALPLNTFHSRRTVFSLLRPLHPLQSHSRRHVTYSFETWGLMSEGHGGIMAQCLLLFDMHTGPPLRTN